MKTRTNMLYWVLMGLVGLIMIIFRWQAKHLLYLMLGIGMLVTAGTGVAGWYQERKAGLPNGLIQLAGCVILAFLGVWVLTHAGAFDRLLNRVIGIVLIVTGVQWLLRNQGLAGSRPIALMACACIILGLLVALTRLGTTIPVVIAGGALVCGALAGAVAEKLSA